MNNIVVIIGRPNVGKSTLFNRLTQTHQAIVDEEEGTTRDRQYGKVEWCGQEFSIIDTGGWMLRSDDFFIKEINTQIRIAIKDADIILFLVDITKGITYLDQQITTLLRKESKPIVLVANKADNYKLYPQSAEFYALGLGEAYNVSSINGMGTGELLDHIISKTTKFTSKIDNNLTIAIPAIAIVGRPNVGKSSLINALIDEERSIVTNIAGTTRDSTYTLYDKFGLKFYLVDTAGIRKKKTKKNSEYYSIVRSIRSIENSDVCILMIDATRGIESQDISIFSLIQKNKKGIVIVVNKWDLIKNKNSKSMHFFEVNIRQRIAPFTDVPIIFSSTTTKQRIYKILQTAKDTYDICKTKIPTHQLDKILLPIISQTPPPINKGKIVRIKYITQLANTKIPSFVFFCNLPQWVKSTYKQFLENQIRKNWKLTGTPINIFIREK
ncbi:MAG: ribosome biogenesis GTPase Der [Bacteroidales bacterium OttesenSCG-928-I14]|jgi:GTP-binding protein|nr:ribosome biogenesis GTPase Der [Bacteroidales bacterium OttesenSCG-928-I14]